MILPEVLVYSNAAREWAERKRCGRGGRRDARLRDARGRTVTIGDWRPEDWEPLLGLYRSLRPAHGMAELPPLSEERRAVWVDALLRRGRNAVARAGRRIVGHAALVPSAAGAVELVAFVHPEYAASGVGGALVDAVRDRARRPGGRLSP